MEYKSNIQEDSNYIKLLEKNVGVGKDVPNAKLDVNGNAIITGSLVGTGTATFASSVTATSFIGSGAGLTGTANNLSIGGNATTATSTPQIGVYGSENTDITGLIPGSTGGTWIKGLNNSHIAVTIDGNDDNDSFNILSNSDTSTNSAPMTRNIFALKRTGNLVVLGNITAPTFIGALTGNASTATSADTLTTARTINGVSFNGSANITVADSTKLPLTGGTLSGNLTVAYSGEPKLTLNNTGATNSWEIFQFNTALFINPRTADGSLIVRNSSNVNTFIINSAGNVGIGKDVPTAKLDVNGNAIITGSLTVTQGITGSIAGNASTATNSTKWNGAIFNGQTTRFAGDLNTLGLSGTSGVYNLDGTLTNSPGTYGTLYAFWNSDISTQFYVSYNNNAYWRKSIGSTYSGSAWRTFLDSSNYNSYSPTLTGTGASGNWNINITGSAATLTTARTINGVSFNGSSNISLTNIDSIGITTVEINRESKSTGVYTYNVNNASLGGSTPSTYWSVIDWGRGLGGSAQLATSWTGGGNSIWFRSLRDVTDNWWEWKELIHSANYTNYAPTKTGTGATGSWGISITGNATTATSASYATSTSETLATVTGRGASTSTAVTLSNTGNIFSGHHYFTPYSTDGNHYPHYNQGSLGNGSKLNLRMYDASNNAVVLYLDGVNKDIKWNNNKIWNEGNDGASSGLDADLLDGNHASAFVLNSSTGSFATQTYVNTAVSNLVDASPATLDTLNELAAALGDDPNFATTVTNSIGTKLPLAGGTMSGAISFAAGQTWPTFNQNTTGTAATLTTARTFQIGNTGKTFNGSANVSWTLAEIGAQAALTNPVTGSGTVNYLPKFTGTSTLGNSTLYQSGSNVGIGTDSPASGYKLDVSGSIVANNTLSIQGIDSANLASATDEVRVSGYGIMGNRGGLYFTNSSATGNIQFGIGGAHAAATKMQINADGNVGIGTTSPGTKLHIEDVTKVLTNNVAGVAQGTLSLVTTDAQATNVGPSLVFGGNFTDGSETRIAYAGIAGRKANSTSVNADGYLSFLTWRSTGLTEAMRITPAGFVGIGSTIPGVRFVNAGGLIATGPTLGSGTVGSQALVSENSLYGMYSGVSNNGDVWHQVQRNDGNAAVYNLLLQPAGGSVGIGTSAFSFGSKFEMRGSSAGPQNGLFLTTNNFTASSAGSALRIGHQASLGSTSATIENLINGGTAFGNLGLQVGGGSVGIGTASPGFTLSVAGNGGFNSSLDIQDPSPSNNGTFKLLHDVSGSILYSNPGSNNGSSVVLQLGINNSEKMRIANNGNVGIGTTSPVGKFNVFTGISGNTQNVVSQQSGSISFSNGSAGSTIPTMSGKSSNSSGLTFLAATNNTNSAADMFFNVRENDDTDFTTLTSSGFKFSRFGTTLIDILRNGNTTFSGDVTISKSPAALNIICPDGGSATINLTSNSTGDGDAIINTTTAEGAAGDLVLKAVGTAGIRIKASGNVSIGTTTSVAKLNVTGASLLDGNIFFSQPAPTALTGSTTLTIAQLLTGIVEITGGGATSQTLPTGPLTDAGILAGALPINNAFDWSIINFAGGAVTLLAGTAHTIRGGATVAIGATGRFRTRKTATSTFITYRIS